MGFEFRPDGDLVNRERDDLIDELAATYGLDVRLVEELLMAGERAAWEDPRGRSVVHWFKRLAGLPTDPGAPAPGRRTAVRAVYGTGGQAGVGRRAVVSPGKRTRTATLAAELTRLAQQASRPEPLESATRARMSELLGADFSQVQVHPDSHEATGSIRAIAKGDEIHFREGAYQPGTREGDRLIAHELTHLVQQRPGRGRQAARRELEREADWAASLVARGEPARVRLRAATGAYAYSDAEDHDVGVEPDAPDQSGVEGGESREPTGVDEDKRGKARDPEARAGQDAAPRTSEEPGQGEAPRDVADAADQTSSARGAPEHSEDGADASAGAASQDAPAASEADSDGGGDLRGELQDVGTPVAAESGGGGAVSAGGGGGAAPKPVKEAPNVAAARPEAAFGQLRGVRPDKQAKVLPELKSAASADVDKARAKSQANPPKQLSTGESAAPSKKGGKPGAEADQRGAPTSAPKNGAEQPVVPKLPDDKAAKQAAQAEAAQAQRTAGQAIQGAAQASAVHFQSLPSGKAAEGDANKMSDADAQAMAGSIDRLSANVANVNTDPGPPPTIEMKGEAKGSADKDRAELEGKAQAAQTQAVADSRVPMGEDSIETMVPTEELTAKPGKGQAPDVPLPTVAGMAPSEEVGIIAQEQHQAEIDAALGKASGDVAGERAKHEQADAQTRVDTDRQIGQLKTQADGEQEGARRVARAEVDRARGEWQGEVDKKGVEARAKADKTVADGMADVETEEEKANQESKKHVEEGQKKADDEKKKGEQEAEEAKKKGEEKSSGFWGWVKSKAQALVDGIKKAISAVIDTVRKAVKAVIDAAKKLAMAAIELARKAIVAVIQAVGKALLAISDVLLAAFPELKAKFQKAIRGMVDKAVDAVNKLAEGLKKAVQKALDLLGAALDKALGLLEKGLHFIVDAAGAAIQAAIKAAEALANMLGVWAKLIVDVAASPGSWISKLGAAVMDGIKNHLWAALKTAVLEWFQSKVFELLGIGGLILQILLDGGITTHDITEMALQALIVAIPVILVTILVEKLLSMIVPAAGAVMAIIEGLIAAWGTVSRIIAAFGAFVAFLLAVKGGGAGPLFAGLLAAAAVVVLDFVANWLLRKLAGPARKVGGKLKKVAEKFKNRRKGKPPKRPKKPAKSPKADHDGPQKPKDKNEPKDKDRDKKDEKDRRNQEILAKAQRELPPKIQSALAKQPTAIGFRARLAMWRVQYRLTALTMRGSGKQFEVHAKVNPEADLGHGFKFERDDILAMVEKVAGEIWDKHYRLKARSGATPDEKQRSASNRDASRDSMQRMQTDASPHLPEGSGGAYLPSRRSDDLRLAAAQKGRQTDVVAGSTAGPGADVDAAHLRTAPGRGAVTSGLDRSTGETFGDLNWDEVVAGLKRGGHSPQNIARAITQLQKGGGIPPEFRGQAHELALMKDLMFRIEVQRQPRAAVYSAMAHEAMSRGVTPQELFTRAHGQGMHPSTPIGAETGWRPDGSWTSPQMHARLGGDAGVAAVREENRQRQIKMLTVWVQARAAAGQLPVGRELGDLEKLVRDWVEGYYRSHPPG